MTIGWNKLTPEHVGSGRLGASRDTGGSCDAIWSPTEFLAEAVPPGACFNTWAAYATWTFCSPTDLLACLGLPCTAFVVEFVRIN